MDFLRDVLVVWLLAQSMFCTGQEEDNFVFVILNQESSLHYNAAQQLASNISLQSKQLGVPCVVHVSSEDWPTLATWTYFPLLERLSDQHGSNSSWVVLLEEWTTVRLEKLLGILQHYSPTLPLFIGRAVKDREETIIHHFARVDHDHPFLYPDSRAGMVLSVPLLNRLAQRWSNTSMQISSDFTIDAQYEFAKFVQSCETELSHHEGFCMQEKPGCAVVFNPTRKCEEVVQAHDIHFAVKSCTQFHAERLPIIQATWLKDATNYAIYSDVEDAAFGTVSLGIPNTERGHCGKTMAIIRRVAQLTSVQWLAVVDDDTLISVSRLRTLLSCYNSKDLVALGEKYGYGATTARGYSYITGGGGMIFSKTLVEQLAKPGMCECPSNDIPDDMFLGMCLKHASVPIIHSSLFHQGRPVDYPEELLEGELPVSFHRYWMLEPMQAFARWLDDNSPAGDSSSDIHSEL
ncbi:hypothetical protein OTU49_008424 [Cherax quadricarinatus]|uniref:Fringe-like glycosyltransferase domain-containing protein n=1 Tax=Cherax quadricarinatus TaxID=27406 RepID=A0AAW0WW63_CHEQU|nr:beta-1,3-glucosyltransferase-like isoform X2 [Cherax quadricarinatus]XP_053654923.1 beta-1,3-glucosyltransferase-like isoform X2 [Cherax quadricarinatus]XP_053654924.1 beta-1,3-glucosyltransferase-like isoform X2 [Cherax quadricarinatus]XP_053654925.1 beta-1,3-glucosyltransferase-like isoform X2 [Cherax quadricarinatus]XP_053654926.1 beta-1,3-glucosyltransferase-like isoform X2 [Cherax quadricarinatus]XP_053654927.1 beta-1,3-glucosyltransferase-like isoform X2 [Cherax quadricarinatus]